MQQLSGIDATFLYQESANVHMHIGSVGIFDPSTAADGIVRFKQIMQTFEERAHLAPYTRQRLFEVPFNADFPYWVKDETFDPEFHIRHIALPKPGDWRQLCIQVARLHSRGLDRSRPLWELYVIEGLDNVEGVPPGCFALVSKMHHAAIDGQSFADIGSALSDPTPEIRKLEGAEKWKAEKEPSPFELAAMALQNNAMKPLRYMEFMQKAMPEWSKALEAISSGRFNPAPRIPRTRFNHTVSPHRVFDGVTFKLDEIKQIKNRGGGTVNDAVLAICSGALRRYLLELEELPEESLVSMCPISLRDPASKASGGNQVASMTVPLHTEISDPVERLKAICAETENAKELTRALGARSILEMVNFMPTQLAALGARVAAEQGLANFVTPSVNTVITNVPGPQVPVYSNGAKHLRGWGLGPVTDGNGLFHSVGSYCGELTIGITCCRVMMPDPARYVACLNAAFEELTQALETEEQPSATVKSAPKKATPKKATPKKATPKKATPKKATPKKATPKKATPKKATPKKKTPKKAAPKKAAPKKATFENRKGNKASS